MNDSKDDIEKLKLIKILSESDFSIGNLYNTSNIQELNETTEKKIIIYRYIYIGENLYFCLYDFSGKLLLSKENLNEINEKNHKFNPSLEFKDVNSLVLFLNDNLFSLEKNSKIIKVKNYTYTFESLIDIIKVRWEISFEEIKNDVIFFYNY